MGWDDSGSFESSVDVLWRLQILALWKGMSSPLVRETDTWDGCIWTVGQCYGFKVDWSPCLCGTDVIGLVLCW